ncbi:serine acetyltransferase [Pseudocitrobacter sp. RIT415]|uniref:serine acetyltransferase n=1 Tax=Pseudocitrobacter TaxID=1504576 RepID=UPI000D3D4536|nr:MULTISPECIES: DapH/DapD/GlmU-related protein [Pseudocitrobacter]RAU47168.1 serine acetyltransferase [Pseudocitrobacter sp. RIT 415]
MEFWRIEVVRKEKFSWRRLLRNKRNRRRNFLFWWRLASEMNRHGSKRQKEVASRISARLKDKFACDVALEAEIGPCLHMPHHTGVVISNRARIGANFTIRQNTTIGGVQGMTDSDYITIGNNVDIGANSCLIGPITVGDNVIIGAMSFVNKNIPDNMIYITTKQSEMRPVPTSFPHMRTPEIIPARATRV